MNRLARLIAANGLMYPRDHSADARLWHGASSKKLNHEDLFHGSVPVLVRPAAQVAASDDTRLIVICAEVGCARMRDVDRDERDVGFEILAGDGSRFANQVIRVAECRSGVVRLSTETSSI